MDVIAIEPNTVVAVDFLAAVVATVVLIANVTAL